MTQQNKNDFPKKNASNQTRRHGMTEKSSEPPEKIRAPEPAKANSDPGGIRSLKTTAAFRAVNFELYARPNKYVMGFGLIAITGCVAYLAYLNAVDENRKAGVYEVYNPDGSLKSTERKTSKWD